MDTSIFLVYGTRVETMQEVLLAAAETPEQAEQARVLFLAQYALRNIVVKERRDN